MDSRDRYYEYWAGKWWFFSTRLWDWLSQGRQPSDGGRYPDVNIVILTDTSFNYTMGYQAIPPNLPQDSSLDRVIEIKDMKEWESDWDKVVPYKLLVYSFYDKSSSLYNAMDKLLEKLDKQYKGKVNFRKLDVDNFEFLARLCGVEGAYPTFVLLKKGRQVGKVIGLKEVELEQSIRRALN